MGHLSAGIRRLFYTWGFFALTLKAIGSFIKRWNVKTAYTLT
jgi:hypothetical protein